MIGTLHHRRITLITLIALITLIFAVSAVVVARLASAAAPGQPNSNAVSGTNGSVVGMAATPSGNGYWLVTSNGNVLPFGDAGNFGNAASIRLYRPIVAMAATPSGKGYWLVASDGGIFGFGDAGWHGSAGHINLYRPIVGMAATPSGKGFWLVASDGGIFGFGDAGWHGSAGHINLYRPIVGMAATQSGKGFWLVASDGGIFGFGDAGFYGSAGAMQLSKPVVGMAAGSTGKGYMLASQDGTVYVFGNVPFAGTGVGCMNGTVVGLAVRDDRYWLAGSNAQTAAFALGYAPSCPSAPAPGRPPSGVNREQQIGAEIMEKLNAERAARGLHPLAWDPGLAIRARDWSIQMKNGAGFRHSDLHPLLGRFHIAAENIGTGPAGVTSGSMHVAWMKSTTHRVNLLAPNLEVVGIGVYCAPDGSLWVTQNFGRFPGSSLPWEFGPTPPQNPIVRNDTGGTSCR